jgi:HK97 family phage prohead protease
MKTEMEYRYLKGLEVRDDSEDGFIGTLEGYAAVFGSDSLELGDRGWSFVERIEPGTFERTLRENPDVRALWNHDPSAVVARSPNTMTLTEDERGLKVSIRLVDTTLNRDLLTNIRSGNVDAMSFGFRAMADKWEEDKENNRDIRTLLDVDLREVSPVTWPAYVDTTIAARSLEKAKDEQREEQISEEDTGQPGEDEEKKPDRMADYYDLTVKQLTL